MPPKGKLSARDLGIFEEWIRRGANYPSASTVTATKEGVDLNEGKKFWSFQPLQKFGPPPTERRDWTQKKIDAFLLAEMEKHRLSPSPVADRRTLIRRVTFDLIGLPPSPKEVEAFVRDDRPTAFPELVERLLASPHYGERWARFWLDLARYCDIGEQWAETKGAPWVYRDWVVGAFNQDLPYDRFVQLQLAADLMPGATPKDRAALGFLGLSPTYWKELQLDPEVIKLVVAEEWEEKIFTVSGTFLGLTAACARCHDHKTDPITMKDYYALAGIFASSRPADHSLLPDKDATEVRRVRGKVAELHQQAKKWAGQKSPEAAAQVKNLNAEIEKLEKATPMLAQPEVPGMVDSALYVMAEGKHRTRLDYKPGQGQDVALQIRGNPSNLGPVVARRFFEVLSVDSSTKVSTGSGRLELAKAIVGDAKALTARVFVNRIWKQHFGTGIVDTPSDFGIQGTRPTHPQLLDDLAYRFVEHGWSLKWLHREIVLSAAYQQTSQHNETKHLFDSDNRFHWRFPRRRLDVEAWRDAMLAVSGLLDKTVGGAPLELTDSNHRRRTLYGTVKRRELSDLLRLHDFPDPVTHNANRTPTATPLQQLFTLNGPLLQQQASALAKRLHQDSPASDDARIQRAYYLLFGRAATSSQVQLAKEFLTAAGPTAWDQYCHALLASNEFLFVD